MHYAGPNWAMCGPTKRGAGPDAGISAGDGPSATGATPVRLNIHPGMLGEAPMVPFNPAPESHLLDLNNSHETPAEEFRTLRTRRIICKHCSRCTPWW